MPRRRAVQFIFCLLGLMLAAPSFVGSVAAESTDVVVTGGFTTTEAGVFKVGIAAMPAEGGCAAATTVDPAFGPFAVDAVGVANGVTPSPLRLCVAYTDTETNRGALKVQVKIDNFKLNPNLIPNSYGADQVDFQIPNRYLVLDSVGAITATGTPPADPGTLTAETDGVGETFDKGPVTIATAGGDKGSGTAIQELNLTLNIPAGVYPGEYDSIITIETVAAG
jgi:hypothetical protein